MCLFGRVTLLWCEPQAVAKKPAGSRMSEIKGLVLFLTCALMKSDLSRWGSRKRLELYFHINVLKISSRAPCERVD
jgi:hypothetical protein